MNTSSYLSKTCAKRFMAFLMLICLPVQSVFAYVNTPISVNRIAQDAYMVTKAPNTKSGDVVLQTKYCYVYAYNEDAIFVTSEETHAEAAILFGSGESCEVVGVKKDSERSFGLFDFLVQLGLSYLTRGAAVRATPVGKGKK